MAEIIKRRHAIASGLDLYFTGEPCRRGHLSERRSNHGTCLACEVVRGKSDEMRAYKAKYRSKNSDKVSAFNAVWRKANSDRVRANRMAYYAENKDRCGAQSIAWAAANREKVNIFISRWKAANSDKVATYSRNRRARIAEAEGTHTAEDVALIRARQKDKCAMCSIKLRRKGHVDHIIAIVKGGTNWPRNLQILCPPCNLSKNAKHPIDFAQELGFLI